MTDIVRERRTFYLAGRDRTGFMLGLSLGQVVAATVALFGAALAATHGRLAAAGLFVAFGLAVVPRWFDSDPLVERLPYLARAHRRRAPGWVTPIPVFAHSGEMVTPPMPPELAGISIVAAAELYPGAREPVGVVRDVADRSWSTTLDVHGKRFALVSEDGQVRLLDGFGRSIAPFCLRRGFRLKWSEFAVPAGVNDQAAYLRSHGHPDPVPASRDTYERLLLQAGPFATRHRTLITLTLDDRWVADLARADRAAQAAEWRAERIPRGEIRRRTAALGRRHRTESAATQLLEETRRLADRLAGDGGLTVSAPLSPDLVARAFRERIDPSAVGILEAVAAATGRPGLGVANCGPTRSARGRRPAARNSPATGDGSWWQADGSYHRAFYCAAFPLQRVMADFLGGLLLQLLEPPAVRNVVCFYLPRTVKQSLDQVRSDASRVQSDEDYRGRRGWRVGGVIGRTKADIDDREQKVLSGFPEFRYALVVVVSGASPADLDRASQATWDAALGRGLELRALNGLHGEAVAAGCPTGRGPSRGWNT